jgi:hypothetical protein
VATPDEVDLLLQHWSGNSLPAQLLEAELNYLEKAYRFGVEIGRRHPPAASFLLHDHWGVDDGRAISGIVRAFATLPHPIATDDADRGVMTIALLSFAIRVLAWLDM